MQVKFQKLRPSAHLPVYQTAEAAGADLMADLDAPMTLASGERALIPTGLAMELPHRFEAQVRPRSGLAVKHGVTVLNAPGTIDADYRGEVKVLLINHGAEPFEITPQMRIAQLVIAEVRQPQFVLADRLEDSARGQGGFGSTGTEGRQA